MPASCLIASATGPRARRSCDLELYLKEEGLIRHVFTFLDVREHQYVRACCRSWRQHLQTLALDTLDLSEQAPVTPATIDRAFFSVIHNYSSVRYLNLSGQRSVNDRDLLVLASTFWTHLEHLNVNDCGEVTDFGLLSVLNAQSLKLQSVSMRHCKQIVGRFSRVQITGRHPALEKLDFYDTRVQYEFVNVLEDLFPSLQQIHVLHTPAHFEFFQKQRWTDLVDDLRFLVKHEMSELPHLQALLDECARRARAFLAGGRDVRVFHRSLLAQGTRSLTDVPLGPGEATSAVLLACSQGLTKILPLLTTTGKCDLEVTDREGASPLCLTVMNGLTEATRLLLEHGADVNKRTQCLATPLYIASELNFDEILETLLQFQARTDRAVVGGATALCVAAKNGNREMVLRLLEATRMQDKKAKTSTSNKSKANMQFVQALFLACERNHVQVVRDLITLTGVHANVLMDRSVSPLYLACQMGHVDVVNELLQRGANPNFRRPHGGVSCLYIAAQEGKARIVEQLIEFKVNVHARMEDLSTALHIAARMGHISVAQVLLQQGACINDQTRSGLTPLYISCEEGHVDMVRFFVAHRCDLDRATCNGTTPLFVASQKGHTAVVRALLVAGADAHQAKHNGTLPMDAASLLGNYEITQLLLHFGARVGGLSLHFAERRQDVKLQTLLMDRYYAQHQELTSSSVDVPF